MAYVDGFVVPVPKGQLAAYRTMARKAGKVWREHGALDYHECVADDVTVGKRTSFPRSVKLQPGEVVVFSYIVYKSRRDRDRINKAVMSDPRLKSMMDPKKRCLSTASACSGAASSHWFACNPARRRNGRPCQMLFRSYRPVRPWLLLVALLLSACASMPSHDPLQVSVAGSRVDTRRGHGAAPAGQTARAEPQRHTDRIRRRVAQPRRHGPGFCEWRERPGRHRTAFRRSGHCRAGDGLVDAHGAPGARHARRQTRRQGHLFDERQAARRIDVRHATLHLEGRIRHAEKARRQAAAGDAP